MGNSDMPNGQLSNQTRDQFKSKLGFIMASAGSAVGLGSIWKFPYLVGENGGGAYVIVYLIAITIIGIPLMIAEFVIGRHSGKSAVEAYGTYCSKFKCVGFFSMIAVSILLSYYSIIGGWTIMYFYLTLTGKLTGLTPEQYGDMFGASSGDMVMAGIFATIFMILTIIVVMKGVSGGIEKVCSVLMPLLFLILLVMTIVGLFLPGGINGVIWLFKPDFSKITGDTVVDAVGQVFFTLSLGAGGMVTYASYLSKKENIPSAAAITTIFDTIVSILAGLAIFPAVFAFGLEPAAGPGLVFITLPNVFEQLPFGTLVAAVFYLLLLFAALPSSINMLEVSVTYGVEKYHMTRPKAAIVLGIIISIIGVPALLSFGPWSHITLFGKGFFDLFDYFVSNIALPVVGLAGSLIIGFNWPKGTVIREVTNEGQIQFKIKDTWYADVKYISPVILTVIFLNAIGIV